MSSGKNTTRREALLGSFGGLLAMGGYYDGDPLIDEGPRPGQRFRAVRNTAKMGVSFELADPGAGVWANAVNGVPRTLDIRQALTLDPSVMGDNLAPGSWIISLQTRLKTPLLTPDAFAGNVVALIEWGSGGSVCSAVVDAWSQVIAVPADEVRVSVISESVGSDPAGAPQEIPYWTSAYECSVGAVRSFSAKPSLATRSYPVFFGGIGGMNRAVPGFSSSGNFRANASPAPGTSPIGTLHYYGGPDLSVTQPVIETLSRMNQLIDIPQGCTMVEAITPWVPNLRGALQFAVQL